MISKRLFSILLILIAISMTGCGFVADGPFGWVLTDSKDPVAIGVGETGTLSGKACAQAFFGLIAFGDASIEAAAAAGGISEIFTVDRKNFSIFGTYTSQCTVATGK